MKNKAFYLIAAVILLTACEDRFGQSSDISITLSESNVYLATGETAVVSATVEPREGIGVLWSSSNELVATVNQYGGIRAVGQGTATIIATTKKGGRVASCDVYVNPIRVSRIDLNKTAIFLQIGGTDPITATVLPANATNRNVTWTTSNATVATVSATGVVTAVGWGNATITATTQDGSFRAICQVTVDKVLVASISLNQTTFTGYLTGTLALEATILPVGATVKTVTWTSSDEDVATVSSAGLVTIVSKSNGATASIRAAATDNPGIWAECLVTVSGVAVDGLELDENTFENFTGETLQLAATITPSTATLKTVIWTTSDATVATVSNTGLVTLVGSSGSAVIKATSLDDSDIFDECAVSIIEENVDERRYRFFHGGVFGPKTWTWDTEVAAPMGSHNWDTWNGTSSFWWSITHAMLNDQVVQDGVGATMTFEPPNIMTKTLRNGTVYTGTFELDFSTEAIQEVTSNTRAIGILKITGGDEELTVLGGSYSPPAGIVARKEIVIMRSTASEMRLYIRHSGGDGYALLFRPVTD